jgi:hypothetical protein
MEKTTTTASDSKKKKWWKKLLALENLFCASAFVFFLVIYTITLCPTVFWWDSGELIANIAILGIPHRPGFPVYVLLAKLFSFLPFWGFAFKINFLSCLFASFSLAIFCRTFQEIVQLFFPDMAEKRGSVLISGLSFLLVYGFTYSFWIQSVRAEVYSLNILFFSLLLFSCIQYLKDRKIKHIYLFFFLFGLGLGNHHLSLLSTAPAFCALFLIFAPESLLHLKKIPFYVSFLLLGLSVYFYLPIRSLSYPPLAWGEVKTVSSSASSIFALDVIKNMNLEFFSGITTKMSQILLLFSDQLTWLCFVISLVGLFLLFRRNWKIWTFLILLVAGNCAAVIFMTTEFISTNPDLHGYLVFSIFALAILYGMGVLFTLISAHRLPSFVRYFSLFIFGAISLFPLFRHFPEADLSDNRIAHDYGLSVISDLDSNSVLFVDNVNLNFILRELQFAEGVRKDVAVIDRGLLSFDWYVKQKRKNQEVLFSGIPGNLIGRPLFETLLKRSLDLSKSTYMEFTERDSGWVNHLIPQGYVFKVSRTPIDQLSEEDLLPQQRWEQNNPFGVNLQSESFDIKDETFPRDWDAQRVFALSFYRLGLFYEWKGMSSVALDKFAQVRKIDPEDEILNLRIENLKEVKALSETLYPEYPPNGAQPPG